MGRLLCTYLIKNNNKLITLILFLILLTAFSLQTAHAWIKSPGNPVLVHDNIGARYPAVLRENSTYYLFYSELNVGDNAYWVKLATATNVDGPYGKCGTVHDRNLQSWMAHAVEMGSVIKVGTTYFMYYSGDDTNLDPNRLIGVSTSTNLYNWSPYNNNPIITLGQGADSQRACLPSVIYKDGQFIMWYIGYNGTSFTICRATSTDGYNWGKYSGNPVFAPAQAGVNNFEDVNVIFDGVKYRMVYCNSNWLNTFYAESVDGINWVPKSNNPVMVGGPTGWDSSRAGMSYLLKDPTTGYVMWYWGYPNDDIGIASNPEPDTVTNLYASSTTTAGTINLNWSAPGADFDISMLPTGSKYRIQYSTWTGIGWSTNVAQVEISTFGVNPGNSSTHQLNNLFDSATYYFRIWASDETQNWSGMSNVTTSYMQLNTTSPTVGITQPTNGSQLSTLSTISGTAQDDVSVSSVTIIVKYISAGTTYFWNGVSWGVSEFWRIGNVYPSSWTYPSGSDVIPTWNSGTQYTIIARAKDSSNNWSTVYATSTFTIRQTGDRTWSAAVSGNASNDDNWTPWGKPVTGESVIFNNTSIQNCTWELAGVILSSMTLQSTYTGMLTISTHVYLNGNLLTYSPGGNVTFSNNVNVRVRGDLQWQRGATYSAGAQIILDGNTTQNLSQSSGYFLAHLAVESSSEVVAVSALTFAPGADFGLRISSGVFRAGTFNHTMGSHWEQTGGTFEAGSSTITFGIGSSPLNVSITTGTGSFNNVLINFSSSVTMLSSIDVNGNLTLSNGEIKLGTFTHTLAGNFTQTGGMFTAGTSTVTFDNSVTTSTIIGNTSFYNLSCVTPGKTIMFTAGSTQTVAGILTLTGSSGNEIKLRSTTDNSKWCLSLNSPQTVSYVDVKDSNANNNTITPNNSINSGNNNANWLFGDTTPPTVAILQPTNNSQLTTLSTISGTAADGVAVSTVAVSVKRIADSYYWTGSNWSSSEVWNGVNNLYTSSWTYISVPTWISGSSYTIVAKVQDTSNNWSTVYSTITFAYDTESPTAYITQPIHNSQLATLNSITGTSADNIAISTVQVRIQDLNNGQYWTGSGWDMSTWLNATGTTTWTYSTVPTWVSNKQYSIAVRAIDTAGNIQSVFTVGISSNVFTYDVSKPTSAVTSPANGSTIDSLATISGTATDNVSLNKIEIKIKDLGQSKYWTGSSWSTSESWVNATGTTDWSYTGLTTGNLTLGTSYWIVSRASDTAGNIESSTIGSSTFTYQDVTAPGKITAFTAIAAGQVSLSWTAPGDDNYSGNVVNGVWRIAYSSNSSVAADSAEYTLYKSSSWTQGTTTYCEMITGLKPQVTYYFWIRAADEIGNYNVWSDTASAVSGSFMLYSEPAGVTGPGDGNVAWGDFDNDGDLDIAVNGYNGTNYKFQVYRNDNGTFNLHSEPAGVNGPAQYGNVAWGDFDNDGDLDLSVTGWDNSGCRFRVYKNNSGTFSLYSNPAGLIGPGEGSSAWGDFDNDGDLDLAVAGYDGSGYRFRVYRNDNGTFVIHQDPSGGTGPGGYGSVSWGDFDNDGDLDLAVNGWDGSGYRFRVYRNDTGNFVLHQEPSGTTGPAQGSVAWGDFDNDGDLDLAVSGYDGGYRFKVYRNDGGNFVLHQEPSGTVGPGGYGSIGWGDFDNDGDLDLAVNGWDGTGNRFRVYKNNSGTFSLGSDPSGLDGPSIGGLSWGDFDNDGDLDLAVNGWSNNEQRMFRIYKSLESDFNNINSIPIAPSSGLSTNYELLANQLRLRWDYGSDTETTQQKGLNYNIRVATSSMVTGSLNHFIVSSSTGFGSSPFMGNYPHGYVIASSTQPGLNLNINLENVTYYWQVQAVDTSLHSSVWSTQQSIFVPIETPAAVTNLSAVPGPQEGSISLSWTSPGDDGTRNNITNGKYKIQYSSYVVTWSTASAQVTQSTSTILGGLQTVTINSLVPRTTYYFYVWMADDVISWSPVSNGATTWAGIVPPSQIVNLVATPQSQVRLNWASPGNDGTVGNVTNGSWQIVYSSITTIPGVAEYQIIKSSSWIPGTTTYCEIVTGLQPRATYYFWIRARDDIESNWSVWSPTAVVVASSFVLYSDPAGVSGPGNGAIAWGDFDSDGDLDLAVSGDDGTGNNRFQIYRNDNGMLNLHSEPSGISAVGDGGISWGDFDNDGDLDIAVNGTDGISSSQFRVYRNDKSVFNLYSEPAGVAGLGNGNVAWGDFDNDGDLDLAVSGTDGAGYRFRIYRNNSGVFSLYSEPAGITGPGQGGLSWGDFDNDGDLDLAVSGWDGAVRMFRIYRSDSNSFVLHQNITGLLDGNVAWGDFDNDGDLDVAVTGNDGSGNKFRIYRNESGTFNLYSEPAGSVGLEYGGLSWGDFDNDGDLDLAVNGYDGDRERFRVYLNNNGEFSLHSNVAGDIGPGNGGVAWGDIDNDGDLDLAVNGYDGTGYTRFRIYRSLETEFNNVNSTPAAPTTGFSTVQQAGQLQLGWDKGTDTQTTQQKGLYYNVKVATSSMVTGSLSHYIVSPSTGAGMSPFMGNYPHGYIIASSTQSGFNLSLVLNPEGCTYYWQVQTIDTGFCASPWSTEQSTYVPNESPTVPGLILPANNLNTNNQSLSFDWTDSTDIISGMSNYELQISTDTGFGIINYSSAPAISQSVISNLPSAVYSWRARSKDNCGNYSSWSETYNLIIDTIPHVYTWDGGGADNKATTAANWVGDVLPTSGDAMIFGSTNPTKYCDWDISRTVEISSFTIESGYSSNVNISTNVIIRNLAVSGGNFNILVDSITLKGNLTYNGGQFTVNTSSIVFLGTTTQTLSLLPGTSFFSLLFYKSNEANTVYCQNSRIYINGNMHFDYGAFNTSGSTVNFRGSTTRYGGGGTYDASGKWIFDGTSNQSLYRVNNEQYYDVEVNKVNGSTLTLTGGGIKITNDLSIYNGILEYDNSNNITLYRNLTVINPGKFNHHNGSIYPDGTKDTVINIPTNQSLMGLYINKSAAYKVSITNDLVLDGTLTTGGTLDIQNRQLTVKGSIWVSNALTCPFVTFGSTVTCYGQIYSSSATFNVLKLAGTNPTIQYVYTANKFVIDSGVNASLYDSNSKLTVLNETDINGSFDIRNGTFTAVGPVQVNNGGVLDFTYSGGGVANFSSLTVNSGGVIKANSTADVLKSTSSLSYFTFNVAGGTVNITGLTISSVNLQGMTINEGSYIQSFSTINFVGIQPNGVALRILSSGTSTYIFNNLNFDASVSTNVYVPNLVSPGYIKILNASGSKSGPNYEYDPDNVVFWNAPAVPTNLLPSTVYLSSITWSWNDNSNEEQGYRVRVSSNNGVVADLSANVSSYNLINLSPNTSYSIYVEAYNVVGSSQSSVVGRYTLANPPTGTYIVNVTSSQIVTQWSQNSNPTGTDYELQYSTASDFSIYSSSITKSLNCSITDLSEYTNYYLHVRSQNGNSITTNYDVTVSTPTLDATPPTVPVLIAPLDSAATSYINQTFVWNPVTDNGSGVANYELQISTDTNFGAIYASSSPTVSQSVVYGLSSMIYSWRVRAIDNSNNYSLWSDVYDLTVDTIAPVSVGFAAIENMSSTVIITTGTATDIMVGLHSQPYYIQMSTDNAVWGNYDSGWVVSSHTWNGLTPNTTYWFRVKTRDSLLNESGYSSASTKITLANLPTGTYVTVASSFSLSINWSNNSNPTGTPYVCEISSVSSFIAFNSSTTFANSASFFALSANNTYYFQVKSVNGDGISSSYTSVISTHTESNVPDNMSFAICNSSFIVVQWSANGNSISTSYELVSSTGNNSSYGIIYTGTSLIYTHSGLTANTTYYYRVRAKNMDNVYSAYAVESSTYTKSAVPGMININSVSETCVTMSWVDTNLAGTKYYVESSTGNNGSYGVIYSGNYLTDITHNGLSLNTTYYYRVRAENFAGEYTSYNTERSTHTLVNSPTNLSFVICYSSSIITQWSANSNSLWTTYELARSVDNSNWSTIYSGTSTQYTNAPLTPNSTHYYKVLAINLDNVKTGYTSGIGTHTLCNLPGVSAFTDISSSTIRANWSANSNSNGTEYYCDISSVAAGVNPQYNSGWTTAVNYLYNTLQENVSYYFQVKARNYDGIETAYTDLGSAVTALTAPLAPTGLQVTSSQVTSLTWSWTDNSVNETGFRVRASSDNGIIANLSADTTYYIETGLSVNTLYQRYVETYNSASSAVSVSSAVYTLANPPASSFIVNSSSFSVGIQWSANGNPSYTRWGIFWSTDNSNYTSLTGFTSNYTNTSFVVADLSASTTYWFKVCAFNEEGIASVFDLAMTTMTLSAPVIQITTGTISGTVKKSDSSNISGVVVELLQSSVVKSSITTDASGNYSITYTTGTYDVRITSSPYYISLLTYNVSLNSNQTTTQNFTLYMSTPAGPTGLQVTSVQVTSLTWTWSDNSNNETGFRVHVSSNNDIIADLPAETTSYVQAGLSPNTSYSIYSEVYNLDGSSVSVSSASYTNTNPPTGTYVTVASSFSLSISWSQNGNPAGTTYVCEISSVTPFTAFDSSTAFANSAEFSALSANNTYYFQVKSVNGNSVSSSYTSVIATHTLCNVPGVATFTNISSSTIRANWTANGNSNGTEYYCDVSSVAVGINPQYNSGWTTAVNYLYNTLQENVTYYFRVKSRSYVGIETSYTDLGSTATALTVPATPTNLLPSTVYLSSITWSWTDNSSNETGFRVRVSSDNGIIANLSADTTYYIETGLSVNTLHQRYVETHNSASSAVSVSSAVYTLANPPASSFIVNSSSFSVGIQWSANGNPSYTRWGIFWSTDNSNYTSLTGFTSNYTNTSFVVADLSASTTYWFKVCAYNEEGIASAFDLAMTTMTLPSPAVQIATGTIAGIVTNGSIPLTGATVQVFSSTGAQVTSAQADTNGIYKITIVTGTYSVQASSSPSYVSLLTSSIVVTANSTTTVNFALQLNISTPLAPSGLQVTSAQATSLTWSWTDATNEDGYRVLSATSIVNSPQSIVQSLPANTTYWIETGLLPNTAYVRYIEAYNASGTSASAPVTRYTLADPPTSSFIVDSSSFSVGIQWSQNGNPSDTTYNVYRSIDGNTFFLLTSTFSLSYADTTGLNPATTYYYKTQAVNGDSVVTAFDVTISTQTLDTEPPIVPVLISPADKSATTNTTQIFDWSDSTDTASGVAGYELQISTDVTFSSDRIIGATTTTISQSVVYGLSSTVYYWRVRATDKSSNCSLWSDVYSLTVDTIPPANVNWTVLTSSSSKITLNWTNPMDTDYGGVMIRISTFTYPLIISEGMLVVTSTSTTYTTSALTLWSTYYFTALSFDTAGNYATGVSTVAISLPGKISPVKIKNLVAVADNQKITLNWETDTSSTSVAKYNIYRSTISTKSDVYAVFIGSVTTTTLLDTGLTNHLTYYYAVTAIDNSGDESDLSNIVGLYPQKIIIPDYIYGRVTQSDGKTPLTGIIVEVLIDSAVIQSVGTDTDGTFAFTGLINLATYTVCATYWVYDQYDQGSCAFKEIKCPNADINFTLEIQYQLGAIIGQLSGYKPVNNEISLAPKYRAMKLNKSELRKAMLSPGNGIGFIELYRRGRLVTKVPLYDDGKYEIPNLLPGRYTLKAYNGATYADPQQIEVYQGSSQTLNFMFRLNIIESKVFCSPNPVRSNRAVLQYTCNLPEHEAEIFVYNIAGELVKIIRDSEIDRSQFPICRYEWNMCNSAGERLAAGIYLYVLKVNNRTIPEDNRTIRKKMAIIR